MDPVCPIAEPLAWPTSLAELEPPERLLVWSFRCGALAMSDHRGHHICLLGNEFTRQFGAAAGRAALGGFIAIIRALVEHARRDLRHHRPYCPCLGVDEAWLICLVGACQHGESRKARVLAELMVAPDGVGDLLGAAEILGRAMSAHALVLPQRTGGHGATVGALPTIH